MKKKKKETRGGTRPGSGRKRKYGTDITVTISFAVPSKRKDEIKKHIKGILPGIIAASL